MYLTDNGKYGTGNGTTWGFLDDAPHTHTHMAAGALQAGGATASQAKTLTAQSPWNLRQQGAITPTNISCIGRRIMTDKYILDEFGKQLILSVRDRTIERFLKVTNGSLKSHEGRELSQLLKQFDDDQIAVIKALLIETIDNALFNFLDMIEEGENGVELIVKQKNVNRISDGLTGELLTSDGWISRFSQVKLHYFLPAFFLTES